MEAKNAVYLVKPDLKRQLQREAEHFYGKHFNLPLDRITIVSYTELSSANTATILEKIDPDLIICDEAHCLRHKDSARTKRFMRFAKEHPNCRYVFLSGTMTTRSVRDYAHLIELALRKNSPLPRGYYEINDWAGALDVKPEYEMDPGVLRHFCVGNETVREGYRRRLVETLGVVATEEGAIGTSLIIRKLTMMVPSDVCDMIEDVEKKWELDGEEIVTAVEMFRALKQLAMGFYYYWDWPGDPDVEWLEARAEWNKEVRQRLQGAGEGFDSPLLLARAAERRQLWDEDGRPKPKPEKMWESESWAAWSLVKDRKPPPTKPAWISDFAICAAIAWAKTQEQPAIIWYSSVALGEKIATLGGYPLFGAATDASESREPVIVASIPTQGTGKNLQHYSRNLVVELPPNGTTFEQLAGRTHRPGQTADEVVIEWFGHTAELENSMAKVLADAEYMEQTTGQRQKVLYATRIEAGE
jgi:hypothetical protein